MAINFPSNPARDDEHTSTGIVWTCISSVFSGDPYDAWGRKASAPGGNPSGGTMISIDMGTFPETENASIDAGSF